MLLGRVYYLAEMTQIEKLKIVLKQQEAENEEVFKQSVWCRKHNFEIQAQVLYEQHQAVDQALRAIRMKVVEEILDV